MQSITIWNRLEPRTREFSMARGLRAQVRDAAWFLGRQWQVGETLGDDGGSPISALVRSESIPLTGFQDASGGPLQPYDDTLPLDARVEADPVVDQLADAVTLGVRFEAMLREEGAAPQAEAFREAFPITVAAPAGAIDSLAATRLRALAAGRTVDGASLAAAAARHGDPATLPVVAGLPGNRQAAARAVGRLVAHWRAVAVRPAAEATSWRPEHLEHSFGVEATTPAGGVSLSAPSHRGGEIDWYTFDTTRGAPADADAEVEVHERAFIPNAISFRGMPSSRWWDFEDGMTDFGRLDAEHVDLAKLVVMEFALVAGDDWFEVPVPVASGSLSRVDLMIVTDTFGERTVVQPTGEQLGDDQRPWRLFALAGADAGRDLLFVPPAVADVTDGPVLEDVLFVRDEMASMGWAVERVLEGPAGDAVDGYEAYRRRIEATPAPAHVRGEGDPPIEYVTGTDVPDNWIPMVPVRMPNGELRLRRGILGAPGARAARGHVLEPGRPFYVADEAVPREGIAVTRRWRRARWHDGRTVVWSSRAAEIAGGEGSSGLRFDVVRPREP